MVRKQKRKRNDGPGLRTRDFERRRRTYGLRTVAAEAAAVAAVAAAVAVAAWAAAY